MLTVRKGDLCRSLWPLACWDCGAEFHWWHGCLSVVSVVCCHVEVYAKGWSLAQWSPTEYVCVWVWSRNLKNEEALSHWGGGGGLLPQKKKNVFFIKCTNAGHICCILGHSVSRGGRISGNNYALLPVHVAINRETLSVDLYCEFLWSILRLLLCWGGGRGAHNNTRTVHKHVISFIKKWIYIRTIKDIRVLLNIP